MRLLDDAVMKNGLAAEDGLPYRAAERCSEVWRLFMPLEQVLRAKSGGCGDIDERKIGVVTDLDRALVGKLKAARGKSSSEPRDLSRVKCAAAE